MPFRSKSQVRRFGAMVRRGEITKAKFKEWLAETPSVKRLPERVKKHKKHGAGNLTIPLSKILGGGR